MVMILMFSSWSCTVHVPLGRRSVHDLYSVADTVVQVVSYIIELQQTEQFVTRHHLYHPLTPIISQVLFPRKGHQSRAQHSQASVSSVVWETERDVFYVLYRRVVCSMLPVSNIWQRPLHHQPACSMFLFIVFVFNFLIWRDRIHSAQSWRCQHFVSERREERRD